MNPTVVIIVKTIIIFFIFFVIASIGEKIIKKMGKSDVNDPEKNIKSTIVSVLFIHKLPLSFFTLFFLFLY